MAGDIYIAIIDGTGLWNDAAYGQSMTHSFCAQISRLMGVPVNGPLCIGTFAQYQRGPSTEGYRTKDKGIEAYRFLAEKKRLDPTARLMLAGYSRGGSAAIIAAEQLDWDGWGVEGMFLFDPVARTVTSSAGEVIPRNVHYVAVASRVINDALVRKYDGTFTRVGKVAAQSNVLRSLSPVASALLGASSKLTSDWSHPMRPGFGKTGIDYMGTGWHRTREFTGSHGALGGVGWKNVEEDAACQNDVADWMSAKFAEVALHITLSSTPPTQIWT